MRKIFLESKMLWPIVVLILILVINLFFDPNFLQIDMRNGRLIGSLIDIINRVAQLMLITIGMTLVIATSAIDLSVGSVVAISGAMASVTVADAANGSLAPLFLSIFLATGLSVLVGA